MTSLSPSDLERSVGGAAPISTDPGVCTPDNPSGARQYHQSLTNDHSGPSALDRVNSAFDRATAPWRTFNSIFGGARGPRPAAPTPQPTPR